MDKGVWEEVIGEDAYKKIVESRNRHEGGVYVKEGEGIPFVKRGKGGSERVCEGTVKKGVYLAV